MYFLLILFFGSLLGITFMIGRKLVVMKNGLMPYKEETVYETPFLEEWKQLTVKNLKKHGYDALVLTIRFYVRSSNFLKNKVEKIRYKNSNGDMVVKKREASGFLKKISVYKRRIKKIKHKIKAEENL